MFSMRWFLSGPTDRRRLERELELGVYWFATVGDIATATELLRSRRGAVLS